MRREMSLVLGAVTARNKVPPEFEKILRQYFDGIPNEDLTRMAEGLAVIGLALYYDVLDCRVSTDTAAWAEGLATQMRTMYPRLVKETTDDAARTVS